MAANTVVYISPSCPSGGQFYACNSTTSRFVGCCNIEACATGCPTQDLMPTSFNASTFGLLPNQECDATSQSQFYVCAQTSPPFLGCCKSDPCLALNNGCPSGDLAAVVLDQGENGNLFLQAVSDFVAQMPLVGSSAGSTTTALAISSTVTISVLTSIPTISPTSSVLSSTSVIPSITLVSTPTSHTSGNGTAAASKSRISKGAIAGTTVASFVLVSGLAVILFFIFKRKPLVRRKSQRFSRATFRQPSLFLPTSQGSDAITIIPGPLGGREDLTPPSSREAGSSGFSTPTKGRIPPPNAGVQGMSEIQNIPPLFAKVEEQPDFGPPPPIQPRSTLRPSPSPDVQARNYSLSQSPRPTNILHDPYTSAMLSNPPSTSPFPPPPTQQIPRISAPLSATTTTTTTSNRNTLWSDINPNNLYAPFPMPPSRTSANSISQQYPFSPQFLANNPIFGSVPSAAGPNFGFPIILSGSPSPSPSPMPVYQEPSHRFSVPGQDMQFQGGMLSTSPPLSSSPPMVFATPPSPLQPTIRTVRNSGHLSEGFTIRAVPLEAVPEEPGAAGSSGPAPSARSSRVSMGLGLSGMRTSPGPAVQIRRMSPLSNVQYPPRSPPDNVSQAGQGYGPGVAGGVSSAVAGDGNRRSRHIPLINYAGYNNGAGGRESGGYMEDYGEPRR